MKRPSPEVINNLEDPEPSKKSKVTREGYYSSFSEPVKQLLNDLGTQELGFTLSDFFTLTGNLDHPD